MLLMILNSTDYFIQLILSDSFAPAVLVFVAGCLLFLILLKRWTKIMRRKKYLASPLSRIDKMEGSEFEKFLAAYFENKGYRVKVTGGTGDYGADLVMKKGGETTVVQAKRYRSRVGVAAIQQVIAAREYYGADNSIAATNSYFTKEAKKLARKTGVVLWDRDSLLAMKKSQGWES